VPVGDMHQLCHLLEPLLVLLLTLVPFLLLLWCNLTNLTMSDTMDSLMCRYEQGISKHDCKDWETQLEREEIVRKLSGVPYEKRAKVSAELIDVDLVRGSTFPKPHARHALPSMLWFSLLSCVLFPLRATWWIRHTNTTVYLLGCLVFCSVLGNLGLYYSTLCPTEESSFCGQITLLELWEPVVLFILLAFLQSHILSPIKSNLEIFPEPPPAASPPPTRNASTVRRGSTRPSPSPRRPSTSAESHPHLRRRRSNKAVLGCWYETVTSGSEAEGHDTEGDEESSGTQLHSEEARTSESESETGQAGGLRIQECDCTEREHENTGRRPEFNTQQSVVITKIGCTIWSPDGAPSKVHLSALEIGNLVFERSKDIPDSVGYAVTGLCCAVVIAFIPLVFKVSALEELFQQAAWMALPHNLLLFLPSFIHTPAPEVSRESAIFYFVIITAALNRLILTVAFFFLLSVAERAFKRRFLTAKLFSHLTSSRRSLKSSLPHFRLYKVRNIKAWLCVRSFLRRRGPQRSVDCIVSTAFLTCICNVAYLCYQLLREDKEDEVSQVTDVNCEVLAWCIAMAIFLIRFMTLASKINQKYRNLSVLLTEQINLYLQMEQKPHKKEQLLLANNVLKLSSDLLKELETPFKIHGLSANPFLYNCTRVLVLSAVSGVLSEMLGFKLKLYKVKIK